MALANPTVNSGDRSTAVGIQQDRRVVDMRDTIYDYDASATPFLTTLSRRLDSVRAGNPEYKHLEDQPLPWWDTIATTWANATALTFTVTNISFFRVGDILRVQTSSLTNGEILKVVTVTVGTSTLAVTRNFAGDQVTGGTAGGTPNGSYVAIIGNVNEENATKRTIKTTLETSLSNYCQIFKDDFGASNTLQASNLYGPKERTRQRRKFAVQHRLAVERSFLFGVKKESTGTGGHKERTTGGLLSWISTNVTNAAGSLTDAILEAWAEQLFRYADSGTKLVIGSRRFMTQLDLIAAGRLETVPGAESYGVKVKRFLSAHGDLMVAGSDVLINDYAGYAFAIDMDNVFKRFMVDDMGAREERLNTNIQDPSADGWEDEYLSEIGLHVVNEAKHGVLKGLT